MDDMTDVAINSVSENVYLTILPRRERVRAYGEFFNRSDLQGARGGRRSFYCELTSQCADTTTCV